MAALELDELIAGMDRLLDAHEAQRADDPGEGNFRCENCTACYSCRFCVDCDSCQDCTYCEECVDCAKCTHGKRCVSCESCTYTEDSRDCVGSQYLTLCVDCKACTHCLGCVGLDGAEFHVLNEKRSRKEYFQILRAVQAELGARMERGWRPEIIGLVVEADTPWIDQAAMSPAEVTHTQDVHDDFSLLRRSRELRDEPSPGAGDSGWAWTHGPEDAPREHTGVEELPPPPPYDTDAGIEPRELSSPWIDEPRRESAWHGEEDDDFGAPGPARRSSAWLDPLDAGPPDVREGESEGTGREGTDREGTGLSRPRGGGLSRGARPARPGARRIPTDPWADAASTGGGLSRGREHGTGSGSVASDSASYSGAGVERRRRGSATGTGSGSASGPSARRHDPDRAPAPTEGNDGGLSRPRKPGRARGVGFGSGEASVSAPTGDVPARPDTRAPAEGDRRSRSPRDGERSGGLRRARRPTRPRSDRDR